MLRGKQLIGTPFTLVAILAQKIDATMPCILYLYEPPELNTHTQDVEWLHHAHCKVDNVDD